MSLPKAAASATMYCSIAFFSTIRSQIAPFPFSICTHTSWPSLTIFPFTHLCGSLCKMVPPTFRMAFS
jgi:hypothetical protein